MPPQRFWAYGLLIESELEIPEMLAVDSSDSSASPDVTVRVGTVPRFLADPLSSTDAFEASKVEMLLRIDGVAHYLVSGGREIVVAPDPAASDHDVRVFLLGTCFGALQQLTGHGDVSRVTPCGEIDQHLRRPRRARRPRQPESGRAPSQARRTRHTHEFVPSGKKPLACSENISA